MGYSTYFTLSKIEGTDQDYNALVKDIKEETDMDFSEKNDSSDEGKWYDYGKDLCRLTKKYPGLLVQLDGDGENSDDLWAARFREGKMEHVSYIRNDVEFENLLSLIEKKKRDTRKPKAEKDKIYIATIAEIDHGDEYYGAILYGKSPKEVKEMVVNFLKTEEDERNLGIDYDEDDILDCVTNGNETSGPDVIEADADDVVFLMYTKVVS